MNKATRPPLVNNKKQRFCPFCTKKINDYFAQKKCPHKECGKELNHLVLPELPSGWKYCQHCVTGHVRYNYKWCPLCHAVTEIGKAYNRLLWNHQREQEEENRKMKQTLDKMLEDAGGQTKKPRIEKPPETKSSSTTENASDEEFLNKSLELESSQKQDDNKPDSKGQSDKSKSLQPESSQKQAENKPDSKGQSDKSTEEESGDENRNSIGDD